MSLDYRTLPLPDPWPGKRNRSPRPSPFKANWGGTMQLLERELRHLSAKSVTLAIGVTARDIRLDGGVRADARIKDAAVCLVFKSGANMLSFPCDTFNFWQDNVRAIALALEALRTVDRYGVQQGKQYEGFKALPSATSATLSVEQAAKTIFTFADDVVIHNTETARNAVRVARSRTHPDRAGGNAEYFQMVQDAAAVLSAHYGVQL